MSLSITPSVIYLGETLTATFKASGGKAPYSYSVTPGGAGGSINPTTGVYTAPTIVLLTIDTVVATDALGATAQATVNVIVDTAIFLNPTRVVVAKGISRSFGATGGTEPYTYSVAAGGAGGTIDSLTGLYTAPNVTGNDVIIATDDLGEVATSLVAIMTPLELFCDILQQEMDLDDGRIYLWDQKINMPIDQDIFIAVGVLNPKPFGNSRVIIPTISGLSEELSVNMHATLSIDIISRGPAARDRKEEVILALNSTYSQSQQEINGFKVFSLSQSFVNLSQEDGAAIPYRFNISCNIQYFVVKSKAIDYYSTFTDTIIINA
jgi:hypothetical protein